MSTTNEKLDDLIRINIDDFLANFGLEKVRWGHHFLETICKPLARRFALQILAFDGMIGEYGLQEASRRTLQRYVNRLDVVGADNLPSDGPLLILANHPGMSDTLALFSSVTRPDLYTVAAARPFLRALPNAQERLIYVDEKSDQRIGTVRRVISHLRQGGAVLICPAGHIEPDPTAMPGAVESLKDWSESIGLFAQFVPDTQIVIAIVSGVIWSYALHHPLTRLRRLQDDRERMSASIQVLIQTLRPDLRPVNVRVAFSLPLMASTPVARDGPRALVRSVIEQAQLLIEQVNTRTTVDRQPFLPLGTATGQDLAG
jgi:hypothetical protein